jgi:hypothetical protein
MKIALVFCVTLLVVSSERFWIALENVDIRKRKIALQEEAVRIIRERENSAPLPAEQKL